jgi:hypothetical protein
MPCARRGLCVAVALPYGPPRRDCAREYTCEKGRDLYIMDDAMAGESSGVTRLTSGDWIVSSSPSGKQRTAPRSQTTSLTLFAGGGESGRLVVVGERGGLAAVSVSGGSSAIATALALMASASGGVTGGRWGAIHLDETDRRGPRRDRGPY